MREYASMLMQTKAPIDHVWISNTGAVTGAPDDWFAVRFTAETGDEYWGLMPGPEFSPRLYRGQNRRYERTVASLFRLANETDWLVASIRLVEFGERVFRHPGTAAISGMEILGLKGRVDWIAQGQHYGLPTEYLDVTRSRDVGEFFARCCPTVDTDPTQPWEVLPRVGYDAVLYTIDVKKLVTGSESEIVVPMGPSPLLRPNRQAAAGLRLKGTDLRSIPAVTEEPLPYSRDRAEVLLHRFDEGAILFPKDAMSEVSHEILTNRTLSADAVRAARRLTGRSFSLGEISEQASRAGYRIIKYQRLLDDEFIARLRQEWDEMASDYLARIKWRGASSSHTP
jgi:hypothetical protein